MLNIHPNVTTRSDYNIYYTKNKYGNKYIRYNDDRVFCLSHNRSYSNCSRKPLDLSYDICDLANDWGLKEESDFGKTPKEFLEHTVLNYTANNQEHLINYILNFIKSDE